MDEIWERAVETALDGQTDHAAVRSLTLDGAVKCVHGRLPHPSVFERFPNLQHLSLANIGVSSLEQFPRLVNLQKLVLSDNRIAGGLECLVEAGLRSLVDLDLSNNRIQFIEDLVPLAELRPVSLDLYECPVTRVKDYRARVFGLIKSLKYLDKMDAEENETPESDEEDEEGEEDEEEDDPGSGEVDGGDRPSRAENGHGSVAADGILDGDEDEESDADEEENEILANGQHESNGFRMVRVEEAGDYENDDEIREEENSSGEEIDEEDAEDDEVVEVHEVADSDDEDDGVEYEEDEDDDIDEDDDEEEVDNEEQGVRSVSSTGRFASAEGEIDGHEQGEDDADEDDNGETGEEDEQGMEEVGYEEEYADEEDEDDDDEENGSGYLIQPVNQHAIANDEDDELSDMEPVNDAEDEEEDDEDIYDEEDVEDDLDNNHQVPQAELPPSSSHSKRKRSGDEDEDDEDSEEEDDMVHQAKLPKKDL